MSSEHNIDVFLVHILKKFFLLVAQLLSLKSILLLLKLVHELHFLLLHLVFPGTSVIVWHCELEESSLSSLCTGLSS